MRISGKDAQESIVLDMNRNLVLSSPFKKNRIKRGTKKKEEPKTKRNRIGRK